MLDNGTVLPIAHALADEVRKLRIFSTHVRYSAGALTVHVFGDTAKLNLYDGYGGIVAGCHFTIKSDDPDTFTVKFVRGPETVEEVHHQFSDPAMLDDLFSWALGHFKTKVRRAP